MNTNCNCWKEGEFARAVKSSLGLEPDEVFREALRKEVRQAVAEASKGAEA